MDIDFGAAKDAANVARHGVSLAFGARVFDDPDHFILPSIRPIDGDDRYKAIGMVDGALWTTVHVMRGPVVCFISVRKEEQSWRRTNVSRLGRTRTIPRTSTSPHRR